jgi:hypothetical protein
LIKGDKKISDHFAPLLSTLLAPNLGHSNFKEGIIIPGIYGKYIK